MDKQNGTRRWGRMFGVMTLVVILGPAGGATQPSAPPELRAMLEGTWELAEWHHEGEVLRPPQIGGIWSNHDGVVLVNLHRRSDGSYQHTASYGTYWMDAETWGYQYERRLSASGPSPDEATVTVTTGLEARSFSITRDGTSVLLDRPGDHREYDERFFRFMPEGRVLRVWRKVD